MADEFDKFKAELLKNPKIKAEYDALASEYETAVAAWEEYEKSGRKSYTLDEVRAELGL